MSTAQHVPALISALEPTIHHYGYFAVGGLLFLEDFGIPAPGETTLIAAAFFAGAGDLNIFLVLLTAFFAAVLGDNLGYLIGRTGGHPLVLRFGKYVFLTSGRLEKAEAFFTRNGGRVVVVARFIEGLRQLNGIIAGITEMHWKKFVAANALGAALWVTTWGLVGYLGGDHIETIYRYGTRVALAAVLVLAGYISYRLLKRRAHKAH
ncbi:MAG: DedA family protein [Candidatus Saccharimonadales bacterium]